MNYTQILKFNMILRRILKLSTPLLSLVPLVIALAVLQPNWLIHLLADQSPDVVYFVETGQPVIALTIDDGPDSTTTPQILDILKQHRAHATFFIITNHLPGNEALIERAVAEGHEIGNHLMFDEPSIDLSLPEFERQLVQADKSLSKYADVHWFRPGSGWYNAEMLTIAKKHHYKTALGSIYPYDPQIPSSWFATQHILTKVHPGAIIILHDGGARGERTAATLKVILPELKDRGYRVVTLSELLELQQTSPSNVHLTKN